MQLHSKQPICISIATTTMSTMGREQAVPTPTIAKRLTAVAVLIAAAASLVMGDAHAQGANMLANDALKALLGKDLPMTTSAANAVGSQVMVDGGAQLSGDGTRQTYKVNKGETLDRIIARTMRGTVADVKLIRRAFVTLNGAAFPRGSPHIILAGAMLQVPTVADLMAMSNGQPVTRDGVGQAGSRGTTDQRKWVRFP